MPILADASTVIQLAPPLPNPQPGDTGIQKLNRLLEYISLLPDSAVLKVPRASFQAVVVVSDRKVEVHTRVLLEVSLNVVCKKEQIASRSMDL